MQIWWAATASSLMRDAIAVSQSLPGPLAIQVGIFIAYLRGGFWGGWAGGWAIVAADVLVMAEDPVLREARLTLLGVLRNSILDIADISELAPEDVKSG